MMSTMMIKRQLDEMEQKLDETVTAVDRGPVKDALRLVVPMMKDQINIMREILDHATHPIIRS